MPVVLISAAVVLGSFAVSRAASIEGEQAPEEVKKTKWTYCAYFPDWERKISYCTKKKLSEAQKECDAMLKSKKIEGTCACTDDESFIGKRCG